MVKKIAKIGLSIDPNSQAVGSNILFDVGQITVDNNDSLISKTSDNLAPIQQLNNEYTIFRKNQGYDLRINFSINQKVKDQISYYEFYLEKKNGTQGDFYYLGMIPSNLYYLKNLHISKGDKLIIKTNYHDGSSYFQSWNLQLNNN